MAKTITVTQVTNPAKVGSPCFFTAAVANTDSSSASLTSLAVSEVTGGGAQISQPNVPAPNAGAGVFPTLGASSTTQFGFSVVFTVPPTPGPNPSNPGGAKPRQPAFPVYPLMRLQIVGQASDGTVFQQVFSCAVISGVVIPPPEEGAANFGQGGCSNIIAVIM